MKTTRYLYECRHCGGCVASKQMHCPYCGNSEGPTREVGALEGGTTEITKEWYRRIEVEPKERV